MPSIYYVCLFYCSFRGLATENGGFRRFYYVTWISRLAFVVCFEVRTHSQMLLTH